jgi:hypothetical protein
VISAYCTAPFQKMLLYKVDPFFEVLKPAQAGFVSID